MVCKNCTKASTNDKGFLVCINVWSDNVGELVGEENSCDRFIDKNEYSELPTT